MDRVRRLHSIYLQQVGLMGWVENLPIDRMNFCVLLDENRVDNTIVLFFLVEW